MHQDGCKKFVLRGGSNGFRIRIFSEQAGPKRGKPSSGAIRCLIPGAHRASPITMTGPPPGASGRASSCPVALISLPASLHAQPHKAATAATGRQRGFHLLLGAVVTDEAFHHPGSEPRREVITPRFGNQLDFSITCIPRSANFLANINLTHSRDFRSASINSLWTSKVFAPEGTL